VICGQPVYRDSERPLTDEGRPRMKND